MNTPLKTSGLVTLALAGFGLAACSPAQEAAALRQIDSTCEAVQTVEAAPAAQPLVNHNKKLVAGQTIVCGVVETVPIPPAAPAP
jgi:hypothetical protein